MDEIANLINKGDFSMAAERLAQLMRESEPDALTYMLAATIDLHFGMYGEAKLNAARGLALSPRDYELYMLLGDALSAENVNQSYLCYRQALDCARSGNAPAEDIAILEERLAAQGERAAVLPLEEIVVDCCDAVVINAAIGNMENPSDVLIMKPGSQPAENSLFALRLAAYGAEDIAVVAPMTNVGAGYRKSDGNDIHRYLYCDGAASEYRVAVSGLPVLVRGSALAAIGGFDESAGRDGYAVYDFCLEALRGGRKNVLCHNSYFSCTESVGDGFAETATEAFRGKWGFSPDYYGNVRGDLLSFIHRDRGESFSVLEVGCGIGATLAKLKYLFPNVEVNGLELVEGAAAIGGTFWNVSCGNIETDDQPYSEHSLDYILFGDVLEHLHDPERVLTDMGKYLKADGRILISLPNLMNAEVIHRLLMGSFTYSDSGILDRTHLKFFTRSEAFAMIERAGYEVDAETYLTVEESSTEAPAHKAFFDSLTAIEGVADRRLFDVFQMHFSIKKHLLDNAAAFC